MEKGMIKFSALGVDYTLRIGLGVLDEYEETYDENSVLVLSKLDNPEADPKQFVKKLVNLFELGLTPRPETRTATRQILDDLGIDTFIDIMTRATNSAFAGADDAEAAEGKKAGNAKARGS